ncbi:hypothetical protein [Mycobacterium vicinigordonae]|uniref:hypothetical protein n=1 Tax=Mycobacterium vicinigordonae TaxID=1719132 RepID=UPI001BB3EEE6|nr:hypothetical protein [Mycobacterium vicinigordonae]
MEFVESPPRAGAPWDGQSWGEAEGAAEKMIYRSMATVGTALVVLGVCLVGFSRNRLRGVGG